MTTATLKPATPTVNDMVNAHIEYVRSRPYDRLPIIEIGVVQEVKHHKGELFMFVLPDSGRSAKWVSEYDFRRYIRAIESPALQMQKATA